MFLFRPILLFLVGCVVTAQSLSDCQVLNANGEDVTADLWIDEDYVLCEGNYACQNYTITHCQAVKCIGLEACFEATMKEIGQLLECQGTHSCHRVTVQFKDDATFVQSMTCQGNTACDVAEIIGPQLQLECFGHKACRKINARIDSIHCTHGDDLYEACTEHASLQANCILCGYFGCNEHVNYCRTKPIDAPEDQRWVPCLPEQAVGIGCTSQQRLALENEIATKGQIMSAEQIDPSEQENSNDDGGSK